MKTIVVHNGTFHPDDVFAAAALLLLLESKNDTGTVIRTRDESVITSADFVCDVGGIFDPQLNRFDHHQIGGAGARPNNIQYASFGLVWKTYGLELCHNNQWVVDFVDQKIVAGIDATDNGQSIRDKKFEDVNPYEFNDIVVSFLPTWREDPSEDLLLEKFNEVVSLAKKILAREIVKATDISLADVEVEKIYHSTEDKKLIVLDRYYPWKKKIMEFPEPLLCVFPNNIVGTWIVYCVPEDMSTFTSRKNLPESWAGLRDNEFAEITGVSDAVFCHRARFMAVAKSKEGALEFAKKALLM
jgi:uncharacterized UPF0160 family protein